MKIGKMYKEKINDFINYLVKEGYDSEKINSIMKNTVVVKYSKDKSTNVTFKYEDEEITQKIHSWFKDYHGFCYNVVIHEGNDIKNIQNIIGINTKNNRKEGIITIIHELLHLLSQNEEIVEDNLKIKSGLYETEYLQNKLIRTYGSDKLNEGVTEYLARKIKAKIYGEYSYTNSVYVYEDLVPIINNFIFEENQVENLLNIYMNNDRKKLYKLIKEKAGISEYRMMRLYLPLVYSKMYKNIIEYRLVKLTKKIIKYYLKTHTKEQLEIVCKKILEDLPKGRYKKLEKVLNLNKGV